MKPKTEELLNMLLWTLDQAMRPTFRNLDQSYEGWAYRKGVLRQAETLAGHGYLERGGSGPDARVYRLTKQGRLHALGGRDPDFEWGRPWDSHWRLVLFDIGEEQAARRDRLRRYLRSRSFGYLQHSVWVSPHPLDQENEVLGGLSVDVESLILLEARPAAGESDQEIVRGAWDFAAINKRYAAHLAVLAARPLEPVQSPGAARKLKDWARRERAAWLHAVTADPMLPRALWPSGYLGSRAWQARRKAFQSIGKLLARFEPEDV
jgi:DNA-binding transcriptional regulator PaaX